MKNKLFNTVVAFAIVILAAYNVYNAQIGKKISTLALANIEAFADDESSDKGTLYGNAAGTSFCCCPGSSSCGASDCSSC